MAKPKKKKSFTRKSAARRPRSARKISKPARKVHTKRPVSKKATKRSPKPSKSKRETATRSPAALLGLNHREKRLDPFTRKQKEASRVRQAVTSLFGLTEEEGGEAEEEEAAPAAEVKE